MRVPLRAPRSRSIVRRTSSPQENWITSRAPWPNSVCRVVRSGSRWTGRMALGCNGSARPPTCWAEDGQAGAGSSAVDSGPPVAGSKGCSNVVIVLSAEGGRLATHTAVVYPKHPVDPYPRRPMLSVPCARTDRDEVRVLMRLARQLHRQQRSADLGGDHKHRPVLAAAIVLLVGHPGPDDLARIRVAIGVRRIRHPHLADGSRLHLDRAVRSRLTRGRVVRSLGA